MMEKGLQAKLRMGVIEEDDIQRGDEILSDEISYI